MSKFRLVNIKDYAIYIDIRGVTKTLPARGYLIVQLGGVEASTLKAKYQDKIVFIAL